MSITFKEFSDILEKKSGTFGAKSKKATYGKDTSLKMKGVKAVAPGGGDKSKEGKLGGGLTFGGGKKGKKPKKDKKPDDKKTEPEKKPEPEKPTFGGIPLTKRTDAEKDKKQREIQKGKQKAGYDKYRVQVAKDKEAERKRIETDKKTSATHDADDQRSDQQKQQDAEKKTKNIEIENKKKEQRIKQRKALTKSEETMKTETTIKEDWIEDELIDKLLSRNRVRAAKIFDAMTKRNKMKYLDTVQSITSRHHGYTDAAVVDALDDFNIDISKEARKTWEEKENQQEAENMHKYVNTLSFDRSVNLWAEAAKKDEDLDPVKGNKTLTKKTQEKITINPMEKQALRHG